MVVRQSYTLQSVPSDISRTHLAPYTVITILLTAFKINKQTKYCRNRLVDNENILIVARGVGD